MLNDHEPHPPVLLSHGRGGEGRPPTTDWLAGLIAAEGAAVATPLPDPGVINPSVRRVALFTEAFLPKVDGVTRTALLTVRYLQQTGRQVLIFAPRPTLSHVGESRVIGIPSLPFPPNPETRAAPPWPPALIALRRFRPDLIHLFSPFSLGAIGLIGGGLLGVPMLANYQTDLPGYTDSYNAPHVRQLFINILRFIHNGCTLTLAPTPSTRAELHAWGFRRLRLWGRGVDAGRFTPTRRRAAWRDRLLAGRGADRLLVLYVGRLSKEKHLETLREIARHPALALTLIGDGHYRAEAERALCANGGSAHFTGPLYGDDLADAYAAGDVFAFPGPEETFGQVVLEAMASGLPAIVTARGGPASYVADGVNGFICPADDGAAFCAAVLRLRDRDRRTAMGAAARHYAESSDWPGVMGQLEGYFTEAAALHGRYHRRYRRRKG